MVESQTTVDFKNQTNASYNACDFHMKCFIMISIEWFYYIKNYQFSILSSDYCEINLSTWISLVVLIFSKIDQTDQIKVSLWL